MMTRATVCFSFVTLFVGFVIGSAVDSPMGMRAAEATSWNVVSSRGRSASARPPGSTVLDESSRVLARIATQVTPAVVHIQSERNDAFRGRIEETGSGVLIKHDKVPGTYVVTNRHVVAAAKMQDIAIRLHDGRELHPQRVWTDKATDVAVLQVAGRNLPTARWGNSDEVEIGHMVLAMGSPFGLSRSVTYGIVSAKARRSLHLGARSEVINQDFLQTDAAINPGNSGGPLVDMRGRVIGINTAIASNSGGNEGIGFAIPCNLVRKVVDELLLNGKVQRAYLGVKLDPDFDADTARRLKLDRVVGARVVEVYANTPASRANLQFDDVVLAFDGIEVQDENHLINLVSLTPVGKRVKLSVWRNGRKIVIEVTLGDREELEQRTEAPPATPDGLQVVPMGLSVHPLDADLTEQLGLDPGSQGVLVLRVDRNSPLAETLRPCDVIREIGGISITSVDDLKRALSLQARRSTVLMRIERREADAASTTTRLCVWHRK